MPKLFSTQNKTFLKQVDKLEKNLNKFICDHWMSLFPQLTFIASEFPVKGQVRSVGTNGRIDILAYNSQTKRFVVFELKKDYDKNITEQAADYREHIQDYFSDVYLLATQKYDVILPKYTEINDKQVEIVLLSKKFSIAQIERVKKNKDNIVTLIKYFWFENDFIFLDYINNDPDEEKIIVASPRKVTQIETIVLPNPDLFEIDRYFNVKEAAKEVFTVFYQFLKSKGEVVIEPQQVVMKVRFKNHTFSAVGSSGKGGRKKVLQLNTNIDVSRANHVAFEDRIRVGEKKKGSLGSERYEVYFQDIEAMQNFIRFIDDIL